MSQRRSAVRVPPEFVQLADDVRVVVNLLNDYLRDGEVDVPGSRAQAEHAQERDFADDQITDPVVHIQVRAHHNLVAAIDHLGGVAACVEAENVALATISLLRPIVVAAGINYYVLDPSITLRERLRRGWNLELESVLEQLNGVDKNDLPTEWEDLARTRHRYLTWAQAHGYERRKRDQRYGQRRYWLADGEQDSPPLSEIKLAEGVLAALGDGNMGKTVYRFTSSFLHAGTRRHDVPAGTRPVRRANSVCRAVGHLDPGHDDLGHGGDAGAAHCRRAVHGVLRLGPSRLGSDRASGHESVGCRHRPRGSSGQTSPKASVRSNRLAAASRQDPNGQKWGIA